MESNIDYPENIMNDFYSSGKLTDKLEGMLKVLENRKLAQETKSYLTGVEVQILENVLKEEIESGNFVLPDDHSDMGWFDLIGLEGKANNSRYGFLRSIAGKVLGYRSRKERLFYLPHDFQDSSFEEFDDKCEGHQIAMSLLQHFGPNPPRGLYLWGNYGTGKTHLSSAFARSLLAELTHGYFKRIADFARGAIREYGSMLKNELLPLIDQRDKFDNEHRRLRKEIELLIKDHMKGLGIDMYEHRNAYDQAEREFKENNNSVLEKRRKRDILIDNILRLNEEISDHDKSYLPIVEEHFRRAWQANKYQPTDLAYATFDYLYERRGDEKFITDFLNRRIIIIDDIHPKRDQDKMEFIQRIIEHRYNEVRTGKTFITSNLSPERLLLGTDYPKEVAERVHSRLREMCMPIEFETEDYRLKIAQKADDEMLALVKSLQIKKKE